MLNLNLLEALDDLDSVNDVAENADPNQDAEKIYRQYNGIPYTTLFEWLDNPEQYTEQILFCGGILAGIPSKEMGTYADIILNKNGEVIKTWIHSLVYLANANLAETAIYEANQIYCRISYEDKKNNIWHHYIKVFSPVDFIDTSHSTLHVGRGLGNPDLKAGLKRFDVKNFIDYKPQSSDLDDHGADYLILVNNGNYKDTEVEYITATRKQVRKGLATGQEAWEKWLTDCGTNNCGLSDLPTIKLAHHFFNADEIAKVVNPRDVDNVNKVKNHHLNTISDLKLKSDVTKAQTLTKNVVDASKKLHKALAQLNPEDITRRNAIKKANVLSDQATELKTDAIRIVSAIDDIKEKSRSPQLEDDK